jgi:drug/metabolite transporter (DMT)-like permease
MSVGQLLFKVGAYRFHGSTFIEWIRSFISNPYLIVAIFLYAFTIIIWIFTLKKLPLSHIYPITAFSYILVPILSWLILDEKVNFTNICGALIIIFGIYVSTLSVPE